MRTVLPFHGRGSREKRHQVWVRNTLTGLYVWCVPCPRRKQKENAQTESKTEMCQWFNWTADVALGVDLLSLLLFFSVELIQQVIWLCILGQRKCEFIKKMATHKHEHPAINALIILLIVSEFTWTLVFTSLLLSTVTRLLRWSFKQHTTKPLLRF